jgi:amino acid transporter
MFIAIGLLSVTYALFTVGMWISLTPEQRLSGTPIPHILFGQNLFGKAGIAFFMVMSILASVTSFNSGLLNTSRFAYAMSRDNVLPTSFSKLHPDYATPWVSILALMIFALILSFAILLTGKYLFIIVMAAALECFIYVVMAVCVIQLRRKMPDNPRDFKVPGGYIIPVITIMVFAGLLIGIFADKSKDYAGNVLFDNYWVAVVMAAFFGICAIYTILVVPVFKKKAAARAATRVKRRPGKG